VLPPGGEGEVQVTLTPKGGQEDIVKHIKVVSNDPAQPRFVLTLKGKLHVDVRADPSYLNLPQLAPGETSKLSFALSLSDPAATKIESVELEDTEHFSLRPLPVEGDGPTYYEVEFRGSKTIGSFATRVEVQTTGAHTPRLDIPVRATVSSNLQYSKRLHFPRRGDEFLPRQIRVSTRDGVTPKLEKVEDPDKLLIIEIREPVDGKITIDLGVDIAKFEALDEAEKKKTRVLTIHSNDPHEPRAEVSYTIGAMPGRARTNRN
jgi:hypothetical protein